jgi:hypothetical protein
MKTTRKMRKVAGSVLVAALLLGGAMWVQAQEPLADACPEGSILEGDIGIGGLECSNCSFRVNEDGERLWMFRSEPVIGSVRAGGPAHGALRGGDLIVAIDGVLITTREGGQRLANIKPGDTVELTIRRGRESRQVAIIAAARCARRTPVVAAPVAAAEPAPAVAVEAVPVPPAADVELAPGIAIPDRFPLAPRVAIERSIRIRGLFPSGWFGFGIRCNCEVQTSQEEEPPVWMFREPPEIFSVEDDSPADRAGLRRGDELTEIDGVALTSEEGGRRFGAIKPGDTVTFTYRRGEQTREVTMTARDRPAPTAALAEEVARAERSRQREATTRQQLIAELEQQRQRQADITRELVEQAARAGDTRAAEVEALMLQLEQQRREQRQLQRELQELVLRQQPAPQPNYDIANQLRYAGTVGNVEIEVRGGSSVIATVIEEGKELLIITRDARIRIKRPD